MSLFTFFVIGLFCVAWVACFLLFDSRKLGVLDKIMLALQSLLLTVLAIAALTAWVLGMAAIYGYAYSAAFFRL